MPDTNIIEKIDLNGVEYQIKDNISGYTTNTGTVTSVSAGTGLSGGPVTTSGSLSLDTTRALTAADIITGTNTDNKLVSAKTLSDVLSGLGGGTVTSVDITDGGGLTVSGGPITSAGSITVGHTNEVTPQTTQAVYPIKIDAQGHISDYGSAVTIPTVVDTYSSTGSNAVSGKAVNAALQTLDSSISATTGQAISAITITDGKIASSTKINVGDANQNAFSNIKVGTTTVAADTTTDTVEFIAGNNITLTPNATNDSITIAASQPTVPSAGTTATAVDTTSSGGSATTWSRSDHVHNITGTTITSALGYTPYDSTNPDGYINGGVNSPSTVTIVPTTDTTYKVTSRGSVTLGSVARFTQGSDSFVAPSLTFTADDANSNLNIGWSAGSFTQGSDSFTANTPTSVTLPGTSNTQITVLTGITSATAAAQTFTGSTGIQSAGDNRF